VLESESLSRSPEGDDDLIELVILPSGVVQGSLPIQTLDQKVVESEFFPISVELFDDLIELASFRRLF
jgi:hypothetical protein